MGLGCEAGFVGCEVFVKNVKWVGDDVDLCEIVGGCREWVNVGVVVSSGEQAALLATSIEGCNGVVVVLVMDHVCVGVSRFCLVC